jgi:Ribosomal RNA adenine dimethylase
MRANTSRELRLAFDSSVEQYDAGRIPFEAGLISNLTAWAELRPRDLVLEVGAGTGQLTSALLGAGLRVVAIEPGPNMAAYLQHRFHDQPGFSLQESLFEDYEAEPWLTRFYVGRRLSSRIVHGSIDSTNRWVWLHGSRANVDRTRSSDAASMAWTTRTSSANGPPNTMKPASTNSSIKAAWSVQPDCCSIGRDGSHAGPDRRSTTWNIGIRQSYHAWDGKTASKNREGQLGEPPAVKGPDRRLRTVDVTSDIGPD